MPYISQNGVPRGPRGRAGQDGAGADVSAAEIEAARVQSVDSAAAAEMDAQAAQEARAGAEAVGTANDTVIASRVADPTSATAVELAKVDRAGRYSQPTLVRPSGLVRWLTRRLTGLTSRQAILFVGDSITAGAWADGIGNPMTEAKAVAWANDGFVGQVRQFLAGVFGDVGEGWITLAAEEARWVYSGTNVVAPVGVASTGRKWTGPGTAVMANSPVCNGIDVIGVRRNGNVAASQNLTGGGVPLLTVDGAEVTPNSLTGSPTAGVAALTAGWTAQNGSLAYPTENGEQLLEHTCTTAGAANIYSPLAATGFAVTAGQQYLLTAEGKPVGFTAQSVWESVRWYAADNTQISETPLATDAAARGQIPADVWTPVTQLVTAPANAVRAAVFLDRGLGLVGEVMRWKRVRMIPVVWTKAAVGDGNVGSGTKADFYRYAVDGLPLTAHNITLTAASGGTTWVSGIRARKGLATAPGLEVHRLGRSGTRSIEHTGSGFSTGTKTDLLVATYEAPATVPVALTCIIIGTNDYNAQTPLATFQTQMQILVDKAVSGGGAGIVISGPRRVDDPAKPIKQQEYTDILRGIVEATAHTAFFDLADAWGGYESATALGYMHDSPHPNATGHKNYARRVLDVVLG